MGERVVHTLGFIILDSLLSFRSWARSNSSASMLSHKHSDVFPSLRSFYAPEHFSLLCCVARLRCRPWMGHERIVDDPQLAADGDFAAWTSVFVDNRNVDTSDFELRGRHWSWLHRRVVRPYVSVSIFVLVSRHFDESFAFGGTGLSRRFCRPALRAI